MKWLLFILSAFSCYGQGLIVNPYRFAASLTAPTFVRAGTNYSASATTLAVSAFSVTGSNPYLLVCVAESSSLTARSISAITANGAAMSLLVSTNYVNTKGLLAVYGLANPTTGDISVTLSGAANGGFSINALLFNGSTSAGGGVYDGDLANNRTSCSISMTGVASDILADFHAPNGSVWTPAGGTIRSTINNCASSTRAATGSTQADTWSGSISSATLIGVLVHGL